MRLPQKKIIVIAGHYGSGKTNFAVNLAVWLSRQNKKVLLIDLDTVNPYFRSADFSGKLEGVEVAAIPYANTNVDLPAVSSEVDKAFADPERYTVIDLGGDDAGATVLGRYAARLEGRYEMLMVINSFRMETNTPEKAFQMLKEIENASRLKVSGIVSNSHYAAKTTPEDINNSMDYAKRTAELSGLPLVYTAVRRDLADKVSVPEQTLFPVDIYVKAFED